MLDTLLSSYGSEETHSQDEVMYDNCSDTEVESLVESSSEEGNEEAPEQNCGHILTKIFVKPCLGMFPSLITDPRRHCTPHGFVRYLRKYFCYGRVFHDDESGEHKERSPPVFTNWFYMTYIYNRPMYVTLFVPAFVIIMAWLIPFQLYDLWDLFVSKKTSTYPWHMSIVMLFGSIVAGATSEGGGSVAFPVLTLAFGVAPPIARDFSLMIQSVGMTAAMLSIIYSKVLIDRNVVIWGSLGSTLGIIFGLAVISPNLPPAFSKIIFVSIWFAFAVNLFMLNRIKKRRTFLTIGSHISLLTKTVLVIAGFIGGILSAISGSGVDICMFGVSTILFRITEKTATPTSVVLMAINTVVGFWFQGLILGGIKEESIIYWACCIPIVPIGAPLGAIVSSFLHRQVLAFAVYFTDTFQLFAALLIVPMTIYLWILAVGLIGVSLLFFAAMALVGQVVLEVRLYRIKKHRKKKEMEAMEMGEEVSSDEIEMQVIEKEEANEEEFSASEDMEADEEVGN